MKMFVLLLTVNVINWVGSYLSLHWYLEINVHLAVSTCGHGEVGVLFVGWLVGCFFGFMCAYSFHWLLCYLLSES